VAHVRMQHVVAVLTAVACGVVAAGLWPAAPAGAVEPVAVVAAAEEPVRLD
jgi:hypothetical protein